MCPVGAVDAAALFWDVREFSPVDMLHEVASGTALGLLYLLLEMSPHFQAIITLPQIYQSSPLPGISGGVCKLSSILGTAHPSPYYILTKSL